MRRTCRTASWASPKGGSEPSAAGLQSAAKCPLAPIFGGLAGDAWRRPSLRTRNAWSSDRGMVGRRSVGRLVLPPDRSNWPLQHPADPNRCRTDMELICALMQGSLRVCRTIALPEVIVPSRAMVPLGPQFGIGKVARDRPSVCAVALSAQLDMLHDCVEESRLFGTDAIFDFQHDRPAPRSQGQAHF